MISKTKSASLFNLIPLMRPHFIIAGLILYIFGVLYAVLTGAEISLPRAIFGYLVLLPAHLSVHFSNDYFDVDVDHAGSPTLFTGGSGVLVKYPELRPLARIIALSLMPCSLILGLIFMIVYDYSPWFMLFVLAGNLIGWFYSAPPVRLVSRGLGELALTSTVGFLIPGMGYLATKGRFDAAALLFLLPLICFGFMFTFNVEIPDIEDDRRGNKRTWVSLQGSNFGFIGAGTLAALITLYFIVIYWRRATIIPMDFRIPALISLIPTSIGLYGFFKRPAERKLAIKVVNSMLTSIPLFFLLLDVYLVFLLKQ
jgi:1,4-dihydroxy-2-naphthoate octaprenyltransferase